MHGTLQLERLADVATLAEYLLQAKSRGFRDKIHAAFDRADKLKIAFVGETILDEYRYVAPLAKPSKEFILATVEVKRPDCFLGGASAAQLHGDWLNTVLVTDDGGPMRKTRYLDADFSRKLFEVYSQPRLELGEERRNRFRMKLCEAAARCDVMIVLDFGHGLMEAEDRRIVQGAKFLAVNAQTNAGNYGFNPVTNYTKPHYVCVDEPEARVATRRQNGFPSAVLDELAAAMPKSMIAMTRGRYGCLSYDVNGVMSDIPPLTVGGIDTMGAGDAFLAVSAPLVAVGLELEIAAFVGNVAGAIKVGILGHQRHVGRVELMAKVEELVG